MEKRCLPSSSIENSAKQISMPSREVPLIIPMTRRGDDNHC
jgi:hypothetical protein